MMRTLFLFLILTASVNLSGQTTVALHAGYLGTITRVAEYERIDRQDHLLDSMTLDKQTGSFQAGLQAEIDLGRNFFLSPGFHYSKKGLARVVFTDSTGWPWQTAARQHYAGISLLFGYRYAFPGSRFGCQLATGLRTDYAVGTPNAGALFSGPYYRFFMPFCRFDETELLWMTEGGLTYKLGPGSVLMRITFLYGLSDALEDNYVIGRTLSGGVSLGYAIKL